MKTVGLLLVLLLAAALPAVCGTYLMNDTGGPIIGLRVVFSAPVRVTAFGDVLTTVEPAGESTEFVFSGGEVEAWGGHWLSWDPESATLVTYELLRSAPEQKPIEAIGTSSTICLGEIVEVDRRLSGLPYTYYYYAPKEMNPDELQTLVHIATASPPIGVIDESEEWARGQLANYVTSGLADTTGLIMFSVAIPQFVRDNPRSGCSQVLQRDNFVVSRVEPQFCRPDLKFLDVVSQFTDLLRHAGCKVNDRFFVTGTSNGGVWAHRFALLHPHHVLGVAAGSTGCWTMPMKRYDGRNMPYHVGIDGLRELGLEEFDAEAVADIPFFVFIGETDTNDPFVERPSGTYGYSEEEIRWYRHTFGETGQKRAEAFHNALLSLGAESTFTVYPGVGHHLNTAMKNDVIRFFTRILAASKN